MDLDLNQSQSINDDQELAKVLAGVSRTNGGGLQFEETGRTATKSPTSTDAVVLPAGHQTGQSVPVTTPQQKIQVKQISPVGPSPVPSRSQLSTTPNAPIQHDDGSTTVPAASLDTIKEIAISELRPLIDKLDIAPEEKFDTYLLLIRSTDDKNLIAPAHETALTISDEARRAQALLDIIKEIDYFSSNRK